MSPMIKEGDPPISTDLLEEARRNLSREYGFALGEEDGRTVLFVRAPEPKPDPFHTLEVVSFSVAEGDLVGVKDVFLLGDERVVRVEPDTLRDLVEERREEDPEVAKHLRNRLDRGHDYTVFRHKGARDHLRLGVRVPRERVDDLRDEDRQALADNLAPILGSVKGRQIRAFYLIGDEHARRVAEDELLDLAAPALREAVEARPEPEGPEDEPEIETEPPEGADTIGTATGGPGADGTPTPDPDASRGAEIIDAESPPPSSGGGASQEAPGQQSPGADLDSGVSGGTGKQQPPGTGLDADGSGGTGKQQPPGASLGDGGSTGSGPSGPGGPPNLDEIDESEIEDDGGAMFLGEDDDEDASAPSPEPEAPAEPETSGPAGGSPGETAGSSPAPGAGTDASSSPSGQETGSPDAAPAGSSPEATPTESSSGSSSDSSSGGSGGSSGGAAELSPDDEGLAGLAGRGSQFDRPQAGETTGGQAPAPDESDDEGAPRDGSPSPDPPAADEAPAQGSGATSAGDTSAPDGDAPTPAGDPSSGDADEGGEPDLGDTDDMIVAEVDQAPDGEVPTPDDSDPSQAGPAASREPAQPGEADGPDAQAAAPEGGSEAAPPQGGPETGTARASDAGGASTPESPAAQAAQRLREAGYEVVEGVEAGGQPFDFAADRDGGKRLLGLAVESLDPAGVEALVEAGRESGADAVLAIPLEVGSGAREAAWGTVVDLVPPRAAADLQL